MARATVSLRELPTLTFVADYHEFDMLTEQFEQIGLPLKVEEIGFDERNTLPYVGIVYAGKFPSKAKIADLLKKYDVKFMD